jgi:hypothetical protein
VLLGAARPVRQRLERLAAGAHLDLLDVLGPAVDLHFELLSFRVEQPAVAARHVGRREPDRVGPEPFEGDRLRVARRERSAPHLVSRLAHAAARARARRSRRAQRSGSRRRRGSSS